MQNRLCAALLAGALLASLGAAPRASKDAPGADLSWLGNTLGMAKVVPPPWTPVAVEGRTVRVWGREVSWQGALLPSRITSQGRDLLAGPMQLRIEAEGAPAALTGAPVRVTASDATHAVLEGAQAAGALEVAVKADVEFDGMIRIALVVTPKRPTTVRLLRMTLPVASAVAEVMSRSLRYDFERQRSDKRDYLASMAHITGRVDLPFNPEVWLGSREVGITWAAETNLQWDLVDGKRALSIVPRAGRTDLEVTFLDHPVRLERSRRFEFALFPTPLKPVDERLRRVRIGAAGRLSSAFAKGVKAGAHEAYAMASARHETFAPWESLPWSDGSARYREVRARLRALGLHYVPYGALAYTNAFHPVGRRFYDAWHAEPVGAGSRARWRRYDRGEPRDLEVAAGRHWDGYRVCPSPRSYADFLVWAYVDAIRSEGIDGIYLDHGDLPACQNPRHHHLRDARGSGDKVFFGVFGARELLKRLWIAAKAEKPDILIIQHQPHTLKSLDSFVDVVVTGEVMNGIFAGRPDSRAVRKDPTLYVPDYDRVPDVVLDYDFLDTLGVESRLLPEVKYVIADYWERHPGLYRFYSDKMLRHTLLRGIRLWAGNMDQGSLVAAWRALDPVSPLGAGTVFHPSWQEDPGLRASRADTLLAHYRREGKMVLIVGTTSHRTVEETIELRAPYAYRRAVDAVDGTPLPFDGRRLRVEVPSERYRAVLLTP